MIPVNEPLLVGNESEYLKEAVESGWISSEGPFVHRFEEQFAKRMGRRFGIAVCNGSMALEASIVALGIGPGDEVILPAFTIISCAAAVVKAGAKPVLVDSDPHSWNMDVAQIEEKITPKTKAIMPVHIYGLPVDMDPLLDLAAKHSLKVIEDAAEAHGLDYKGKPCGCFGDLSVFSFYPNKHVTTGEGGMMLTDDEELAERCRSLRNLCFQKDRRFVHEELGWNLRMSNLQAAVGLAQLENLDRFLDIKRRMGNTYNKLLNDCAGLQLPLKTTEYAENVYWVYGLLLQDDASSNVAELTDSLHRRKIGTRPFFWPMHEQPVFKKMGLFVEDRYPVAENLARRGFYIPSGLALKEEQIEEVAKALIEVLG